MTSLMHVRIDSTDPFERGRQRGAQVAERLPHTWSTYQRLFAAAAGDAGREPVDVRALADACLHSVSSWSPDLLRELEGVSAGAGVDVETVMALNARTEVFAAARASGPTECSTLVEMPGESGSALAAQTWDWHDELSQGWHLQTVRGCEHPFVGLTEFAMLAKIGVNAAGLGVCFNLLRHASDASSEYGGLPHPRGTSGGVPVHLVAREVLGRASTVADAVALAGSAPVLASTVITVFTSTEAACVEISPEGVGVVEPEDGWLLHTNHFLDPHLSAGERVTQEVTTTFERAELLRSRVKGVEHPLDLDGVVALLDAHEEDGVPVCRHSDPTAPTGYRAATLATVGIDPSRRSVSVSEGGPCRRTDAIVLTASR